MATCWRWWRWRGCAASVRAPPSRASGCPACPPPATPRSTPCSSQAGRYLQPERLRVKNRPSALRRDRTKGRHLASASPAPCNCRRRRHRRRLGTPRKGCRLCRPTRSRRGCSPADGSDGDLSAGCLGSKRNYQVNVRFWKCNCAAAEEEVNGDAHRKVHQG